MEDGDRVLLCRKLLRLRIGAADGYRDLGCRDLLTETDVPEFRVPGCGVSIYGTD